MEIFSYTDLRQAYDTLTSVRQFLDRAIKNEITVAQAVKLLHDSGFSVNDELESHVDFFVTNQQAALPRDNN